MSYSGMTFKNDHILMEEEYSLLYEAQVASLLTTGNGYMGVRASLEEYASLGIQGLLVRGVMDDVVEVRLTMCDNMYMKKFYVEEERLKEFEKEERAINLLDFLLLRFEIDGEVFYPWEGNLISWKRWLDLSDETLNREVIWENGKGQQSKLTFSRFASFADDHTYCIKASITPLNYSAKVRILSGLELRTKSNGQRPQKSLAVGFGENTLWQEELVGERFGFKAITGVRNSLSVPASVENVNEGGLVYQAYSIDAKEGQTYSIEKLTATITTRDFEEGKVLRGGELLNPESLQGTAQNYLAAFALSSYDKEYEKHVAIYKDLMAALEITIKGDDEADRAIRFSNYHTLLSVARNDYVHSFSAKGLTGETYNNFVWWDAEIFQAPVFQMTVPEISKNNILFRYSHLPEAKELAKKEGYKGARFPFTTGVTGEETVWIDVRHPFMQIHCVSDVALSVINYFACTGDEELLKQVGLEILLEVCRYWISRVVYNKEKDQYEILQVTGTDEHHPYVDNNAYTNYSVQKVLTETLRLFTAYGDEVPELTARMGLTQEEGNLVASVAEKLYIPYIEKTGMIPQFDGYFDLSKDLEVQGGSKSGYTQMKQAGLYNKSQVIKQPDVLNIFAYQNLELPRRDYSRNLDYYLARCEAASSLSYCVHSICCSDMDQPDRAYSYLMETAEMDLKNMHGGTENGVHSGCATGAWMAVVRGLAGMKMKETHVEFEPHFLPWWEEVRFHCIWHGQGYTVVVNNDAITVTADATNTSILPLVMNKMGCALQPGESQSSEL